MEVLDVGRQTVYGSEAATASVDPGTMPLDLAESRLDKDQFRFDEAETRVDQRRRGYPLATQANMTKEL